MRLRFNWSALAALGVRAAAGVLRAAPIEGFQPEGEFREAEPLPLQPRRSGFNEGWLLQLT